MFEPLGAHGSLEWFGKLWQWWTNNEKVEDLKKCSITKKLFFIPNHHWSTPVLLFGYTTVQVVSFFGAAQHSNFPGCGGNSEGGEQCIFVHTIETDIEH